MSAKVFASFSPDSDRPMVMIYGNPEGLRRLANKLIEFADFQQNESGHDPGEHWHLFPGNHDLLESSFEVMVSRMDDRKTGETTWCEQLLEDGQQRLLHRLSKLST
jgi:hypothetical protein